MNTNVNIDNSFGTSNINTNSNITIANIDKKYINNNFNNIIINKINKI